MARSVGRDHAVVASREHNFQLRQLRRHLSRTEHTARANHRTLHTDPAVLHARQALRQITDDAAGRSILRARVQWLEEGERCTQYFFNRHGNQSATSQLSGLSDDHGLPFSSPTDRHIHIRSFYSNLYTAPTPNTPAIDTFLRPLDLPVLSSEDIHALSSPITDKELATAVHSLPPRKSPGLDGLPYEWYQQYLSFLSAPLLDLFNGILAGASPPRSWFKTTITLLPKPDRDHSQIRNWRPITLSNCDAKLFSRILANRLARVLPHLVHPDQAGFIRGRSAPDVALTLKTVLAHAATHSVDGALVCLDQEKAYDRVCHSYLATVLQSFGFPSSLTSVFLNTSGPSTAYIMD
jgi:hypothetical protein